MLRLRLIRFPLAAASLFALGACGGSTGSLPGSSPAQSAGSLSIARQLLAPEAGVTKVAGTYTGTIHETEGSHMLSGTVVITIVQSGSTISGTFDPTFGSRTAMLTIAGSVAQIKDGAKLTFTIINPNGRNASAKAKVDGLKLKGTAFVPPSGSQPAVNISYAAKK